MAVFFFLFFFFFVPLSFSVLTRVGRMGRGENIS